MAEEGKIQLVNLFPGQSKGRYLGSHKPKTVVQKLHRKHTPTLTTYMANYYKILCILDKYNGAMSSIWRGKASLCHRASSTYNIEV